MRRIILAFIFSPALTSALLAAILFGSGYPFAILIVIFSIPISYTATFIGAVPAFFLYRKKRWLAYWKTALLGLLLGALVQSIMFGWHDDETRTILPSFGFVCASLFWWIAIRKNAYFMKSETIDHETKL